MRRGCFVGDVSLSEAAAELPEQFVDAVALDISEEDYCAKIRRVKEYIRAGETYQVNFTDRVCVETGVSAAAAFGALVRQQPVAYGSFAACCGAACAVAFAGAVFSEGAGQDCDAADEGHDAAWARLRGGSGSGGAVAER